MRWQKDKDPLVPGRAGSDRPPFPISLVALAACALMLFSFYLWDGTAGTGDVSCAVSYFADFFSENDAIAVFLGWSGE